MGLLAGTRLGSYEILSALGAGGMGEVYRAHDTKLNRDVALKVLPESLVHDAERVARFRREAQVLASLNHPHIGGIYGLEEANDISALVLELVDGPTLADRIALGPIPLEEALPIARQIAEALEAAHEQGIIHRDLKPANIKVRPDGTVKVLDFGLAKALEAPGSGLQASGQSQSMSPTITSPARTQAGMILGTAAYMSPEQARGKPVDKRADIWAFGCVLYEMLTGHRAFPGDDLTDVIVSVVSKEPDWGALPPSTPASVRRLLRRALVKDPRQRPGDMRDARLEIEEALAGKTDVDPSVSIPAASSAPAVASPKRIVATVGAALLAGGAIGIIATAVMLRRPTAQPPNPVRATVTVADGQTFSVSSPDRDVAIAPDGRHLVFSAGTSGLSAQLVVRALDQLETVPLRDIAGARWPFISADSRWIGFFTTNTSRGTSELRKVPMAGGVTTTLCSFQGVLTGATWGADNTIVFSTNDPTTGLLRVSAEGGEPTVLIKSDPTQNEGDYAFPSFLPGGQSVLFTIVPKAGTLENAQVAVLDLKTGHKKILIRGGRQAEFIESGHLIYSSGGVLHAVRFNPSTLEIVDESVPVVEKVLTKAIGVSPAEFSVSQQGILLYVAGTVGIAPRTLVWVERGGREEPIDVPARPYTYARLSPDGTRVALDARDDNEIWVWDLARRTLQRLTNDPGSNRLPVWTPDGKRLAFTAERDGVESIYWQAFDGSGTMERLSVGTQNEGPISFSPDGKQLTFSTPMTQPFDLGVLSLDPTHTSTMLLHSPAGETNGEISPDGRWLAYQSDESGASEVYLRPFPNIEAGRRQVSTAGGTRPLWAPNGRELFYYVAPDTIMTVPVHLGSDVVLGNPKAVIKGPYAVALNAGRHYDVSRDGQRFLLLKDATLPNGAKPASPEIQLVLNWIEELKQRVPTKQ